MEEEVRGTWQEQGGKYRCDIQRRYELQDVCVKEMHSTKMTVLR